MRVSRVVAPLLGLAVIAAVLPVSLPLPPDGLFDAPDPALATDVGARYEEAGDPQRAEQVYRQALAADPGYAEIRLRLARLLLRRGAAADAREQVRQALLVQPNRQALIDLLAAAERQIAGAPR
jgi:tetratricopeptide (TPR) repeat protein